MGGGKHHGHSPDTSGLEAASIRAQQAQIQLGREQLAESRRQYDRMAPYYQRLATAQADSQQQQMKQAKEYYDYWKGTMKPVEERLVKEAQEFNTEDYRRQLASKAAADVAASSANQRAQTERQMESMGVNPNSGRFQGLGKASALQEAALRAKAMTGARQYSRKEGAQKLYRAAALGRGLPSQSTAAYGGASTAAATGGALASQPGQQYAQQYAAGVGTIGEGYKMGLSGQKAALDARARYQAAQASSGGGGGALSGIGSLVGAAAAAYSAFSDRKLKTDINYVGKDKDTGLNIYTFKYKHKKGLYKGVIADEVEKVIPEAVNKINGYKYVDYKKLNIKFERVE